MKKLLYFTLFFCLCSTVALAQMQDGKFGNEWIDYDQSYYKLMIAEDGVYRISQQVLSQAGLPLSEIAAGDYQLYRMGEQVPLFVSTNSTLENGDYIEFYGQKNRSELDRHLFDNPDTEMLNPEYSLFTDTMSYFLTWSGQGENERHTVLQNDISITPQAEPFFWYEDMQVFSRLPNNTNGHVKQRINTQGVAYSDFRTGEGFSRGFQRNSTVTELTFAPVHVFSGTENSVFRTRFTVNNPVNPSGHQQIITINNAEVFNSSMTDFEVRDLNFNVATSSLGEEVKIKYQGNAGGNDKQAVAIASLTYPREFNFDNQSYFEFNIAPSQSNIFLQIENFNYNNGNAVLYDVTNNLRITTTIDANLVKVVLPASAVDRKLILFNEAVAPRTISGLNNVVFEDMSQQDIEFLIISNPRLYNDAQGINQVQAYADYRSSAAGGNHITKIVDIDKLYDQFAYGVHRHPLSVKNFMQRVYTQWSNLKYLLIIGKGREYHLTRSEGEMAAAQATFFVPTYGYPGSDNMLVSANGDRFPLVATGRIAATNAEDIAIYLRKVRDMEQVQQNSGQTIEERGWMKQILHLGGGGAGGEREVIRRHLEGMESLIENNLFGAEVTSVFKRSNDAVQNSRSEKIFERINEGVSIITFFGHSGVGTFDFNIDNLELYNNYKKYPMIISMGCYSGNIHTSSDGISERFVYSEDRGAIGFGATTGLGYISGLHPFMTRFYELAGGTLYGHGMGDIMRSTIESYNTSVNITTGPLSQQFTLQGDPALRLNPSEGPDYIVDFNSVVFQPSIITSDIDSFDIEFSLINLGRGLSDSINIIIEQTVPSGERSIIATRRLLAPTNKADLQITLASKKEEAIGLNQIFISVDTDNEVAELPAPASELNNSLTNNSGEEGVVLFVISNDARPIFPEEFAIVNTTSVDLIASTSNPISIQKDYILEMDTTELFNSPLKERGTINQKGGVIKWNPNTSFVNGQTYYWRVSPDSISPLTPYIWNGSSFTYLPDESRGWNQSHYFQYEKNNFTNMELLESSRKIDFLNELRETRIRNKVPEPDNLPNILQEGAVVGKIFPWNLNDGIAVIVRDPITLSWKENPPGGLYGSTHNNQLGRFFLFKTDTQADRKNLIDFLNDQVADDDYVFVFSVLRSLDADLHIDEWETDATTLGTTIFDVLEAQGANQIRQLLDNGSVPYGLIYQKNKRLLSEDIALTIEGEINPFFNLTRNQTSGAFQSTDIGPASSWTSLNWSADNSDSVTDTVRLNIYGLDETASNPTLLAENIQTTIYPLDNVNTAEYPYLRLEYSAVDSEKRTSNQIDHWRIAYEGLPDVAINSDEKFIFYNDTISQGEDIQIEIAIENVSDYNMDSLLIKHTLIDESNNSVLIQKRVQPIVAGASFIEEVIFENKVLSGNLTYIMEVNPGKDQPERYHFNNILIKQLFINEDKSNPLLNVTFDGSYIMNGDIVSAEPQIEIRLNDENKFLALADTSLIQVAITYPNGQAKLISYNNEIMDFTPAVAGEIDQKNEAILKLTPQFLENGIYQLTVNAEDVSANISGEYSYSISFEVINEPGISNVINYPNPFSTSTQFVYTLTGAQSPSTYKIQIFTVSGKVVREITQDEIGPLKIGTHRTDYRWDGTDEYGGRLANGVYLYRMITKDEDGNDYEKLNRQQTNSTNKFFKHDFGKMVILR